WRAWGRALGKGQDRKMRHSPLRFAATSHVCRPAPMTLALALALASLTGPAAAQQQGTPKAPPASKATPAPAQKGAAAPSEQSQSAWVKLCEKATAVKADKEGKEEKKDISICLTHHERLDGNTGMVLVSAAVRQIEGQDKQHFMVMVPLGVLLQPG